MRNLLLIILICISQFSFSQNKFIIGNLQVNNLLDNSTFPSEVGFQFHTRVSLGAQIPLYYDIEKEREIFSIELGVGTFMTSMYFKNSILDNPRSQGSGGVISGFFFKAEQSVNIYQNKKRTIFLHASLNNVLHIMPNSETMSGFTRKDSSTISIITTVNSNALQYAIEPYLGVSYLWKFKKSSNGLLFRVKRGFVFHEQSIAVMRISDTNETTNIKFNNNNWTLSIAYLLRKNQ